MRLGLARFLRLFFASFFIQSSWSFFSMQAMGFLFNLLMGLNDKEKRKQGFREHKGFFNTHPYMASYIIGATVAAYDREERPEEIKKFTAIAQTSFASAGDQLFWQTIRPALLLLAVVSGMKFGVVGSIIFLVAYNIIHLYHRAKGIIDGYNMGKNVVYLLQSKRFALVQRIGEIIGAFLLGLLILLLPRGTESILILPVALIFFLMLIKRFSPIFIFVLVLFIIIFLALLGL